MNISFDKQISSLEREILLKSVEIHDSGDDFQFELNKFFSQKEIIAIAPRCIICVLTNVRLMLLNQLIFLK